MEAGDARFLVTSPQHVGPSSVLEFELVMDCLFAAPRHESSPPLRLEYSTDHGMSWELVLQGCHPPRTCSHYHSASVYHAEEFTRWRRVAIVLPLATWYATTVLICSSTLPYLTSGVDRLLHLPSAEAISAWPNTCPRM